MSLRLLTLVALPLLTSACGSHFVKGWRDNDEPARTGPATCEDKYMWDSTTARCVKRSTFELGSIDSAEDCRATGRSIWVEDKCIANSDANHAQCDSIPGWTWKEETCRENKELECTSQPNRAWVDGTCVGKPALETSGGALTQALTAGNAITPIDLQVSPGAKPALINNATCPNFLSIKNGTQLVSGDSYALASSTTRCDLDIVAETTAAKSDVKHVTVMIERGFYAICNGGHATPAENNALRILKDVLRKATCEELNASLMEQATLDLRPSYDRQLILSDLTVLRGLKKLVWLDLSADNNRLNNVEDLSPLASLPALQTLWLTGNRSLKDLSPLAKSPTLIKLDVTNTAVTQNRTEATCPTAAGTNPEVLQVCKN